jgi:hypothetical protein
VRKSGDDKGADLCLGVSVPFAHSHEAAGPSRSSMLFLDQARWQAIWPGASIFSVFLAFNLFGDGAGQRA